MARSAILLVAVFVLSLQVLGESPYITQAASKSSSTSAELTYKITSREYNSHNITAYYAFIKNPIDHFRILYPQSSNGSCEGYLRTANVAKQQGCEYATNGGPFIMYQKPGNPTCLANIVSDGKIVQMQSTTNINFGLTKSGNFVMGTLNNSNIQDLDFEQLVTGFGWLVREGKNQVTSSGGQIAPRTAIGTNAAGNLFIFEADGMEDTDDGLTLQQTAEWVLDLGAYSMVNLDGGGSSVTVVNGTIVDYPTCRDTTLKCERFVTTMTCVMP